MSNKSYSEWVKKCMRDPLWWTELVSAAIAAIIAILDLTGVITRYGTPLDVVFNVCLGIFGLTLILVAVRGRDIGADKPMTTSSRIFTAILGVIVAVIMFSLGIFPKL